MCHQIFAYKNKLDNHKLNVIPCKYQKKNKKYILVEVGCITLNVKILHSEHSC